MRVGLPDRLDRFFRQPPAVHKALSLQAHERFDELVKAEGERLRTALQASFAKGDPETRWAVARFAAAATEYFHGGPVPRFSAGCIRIYNPVGVYLSNWAAEALKSDRPLALRLLRDNDPNVATTAAQALSGAGSDEAELQLGVYRSDVRPPFRGLAYAFSGNGDTPADAQTRYEALTDSSVEIRREAVVRMERAERRSALARLRREPSPTREQTWATLALAVFVKDATVAPLARAHANDADPDMFFSVLEVADALKIPLPLRAVERALRDKDAAVRRLGVLVSARSGIPLSRARKMFDDRDTLISSSALTAYCEVAGASEIPMLVERLLPSGVSYSADLADLFKRLGSAAVPAARKLMASQERARRDAGIQFAAATGDSGLVREVIALGQSTVQADRLALIEATFFLPKQMASQVLDRLSQDSDAEVATSASRMIERLARA